MERKPRVKVSSLARLALAKEKARIKGPGLVTVIDELERAAGAWQRQRVREGRGFSEELNR